MATATRLGGTIVDGTSFGQLKGYVNSRRSRLAIGSAYLHVYLESHLLALGAGPLRVSAARKSKECKHQHG
jgi:hypothetical protein